MQPYVSNEKKYSQKQEVIMLKRQRKTG